MEIVVLVPAEIGWAFGFAAGFAAVSVAGSVVVHAVLTAVLIGTDIGWVLGFAAASAAEHSAVVLTGAGIGSSGVAEASAWHVAGVGSEVSSGALPAAGRCFLEMRLHSKSAIADA